MAGLAVGQTVVALAGLAVVAGAAPMGAQANDFPGVTAAAVLELSPDRCDLATAAHSIPLSCSTARARLSSATS